MWVAEAPLLFQTVKMSPQPLARDQGQTLIQQRTPANKNVVALFQKDEDIDHTLGYLVCVFYVSRI